MALAMQSRAFRPSIPGRRALARLSVALDDVLWPSWSESVGGPAAELLYMPFLKWQLDTMESLGAEPQELEPRLAYARCDKPARMGSRLYSVEGIFRRIRMTYFDGGDSIQVFNSLWYPSFDRCEAPLLGIDLLAFGGGKKLLCVVDAQPPHGRNPTLPWNVPHDATRLAAIREAAPELSGQVSERWYDDNRYFSPQMLYSRFENSGVQGVKSVLYPAFRAYLHAYVQIVEACPSLQDEAHIAHNRRAHAAFDAWNAARDPAQSLFKSYFGGQFADDYVHDFLFALSHEAPTGLVDSD